MAGDLPEGATVPDDVPNARTHSTGYFTRQLCAWAAMGFRTPKIAYVNGALDVG